MSLLAAEMRHNDKTTCILEDRKRRDRKNLCKAITDFQQSLQKPENRREFDLSDPLALKKDLPARRSDDDVRNTVSGMQRFMGEDLNFHERKKFQQEQNREWSLQQQKEWKNARADHKCAGNETKTRVDFNTFFNRPAPVFGLFCFEVLLMSCRGGRETSEPVFQVYTSPAPCQSHRKHFLSLRSVWAPGGAGAPCNSEPVPALVTLCWEDQGNYMGPVCVRVSPVGHSYHPPTPGLPPLSMGTPFLQLPRPQPQVISTLSFLSNATSSPKEVMHISATITTLDCYQLSQLDCCNSLCWSPCFCPCPLLTSSRLHSAARMILLKVELA